MARFSVRQRLEWSDIEEYQQQTVVDTRIETGQPSLPNLALLRPLNTANVSSAIAKAQDIQFSSLPNAICDGRKQFSSNFVNIFNAKYGDEPPPKRAKIDVHSDGSSIGRETPRHRSSSSCTITKPVVVPVISLDNQNHNENSGNPDIQGVPKNLLESGAHKTPFLDTFT